MLLNDLRPVLAFFIVEEIRLVGLLHPATPKHLDIGTRIADEGLAVIFQAVSRQLWTRVSGVVVVRGLAFGIDGGVRGCPGFMLGSGISKSGGAYEEEDE